MKFRQKYIVILLLIGLCLINIATCHAKVIRVPHLMLALDMKQRSTEHGSNWEITKIMVKGKKLVYHYEYIGYHPDPYFRRKMDKERDLSAKEMAGLIKMVEDNGLLKKVIDNRSHTSTEDSFRVDLMIKLKERTVRTRLSGLVSEFKKEQKGKVDSYRHYQNIVSFADYVKNLAFTK